MAASNSCSICNSPFERRSPSQKYCPPCSEVRDLERKRMWAADHYAERDKQVSQRAYTKQRALLAEVGTAASAENRQSIAWVDSDAPDLLWLTRVRVPFGYAFSKNHIYAMNARGHIYQRGESAAARQLLADTIALAVKRHLVVQNKLWIDILVEKPNHKGDAVNVVDLVCDAIKDALPLDDRWYCIRRLDWQIVKTEPMLYIGIGQDSDQDCQACSTCGQVLPFDAFPKNASNKNGITRVCRECRSAIRTKGGQA